MEGYMDNPVDHRGEEVARITEAKTKEINKMSVEDMAWELNELTSNVALYSSVYDFLLDELRKHELAEFIYDYLEDKLSSNLAEMIELFKKESEVRKMMIETYVDREVSELCN